jgi:phosphoglycolate phosphatase
MPGEIKALLFDMDGVLVDSKDSWLAALNEAMGAYGQPSITKDEFMETYWGDDLKVILKNMGLPLGISDFCLSTYPNHTGAVTVFQETRIVLEMLDDYPKAVVTNTPSACTTQILDTYGLSPFFETVVTSDMVDRGKPHPDMLLKACGDLGVDIGDCILIGDTKIDVEAGRNAGCPIVGIGVEGDMTIQSLSELPLALRRWSCR